MRVLHKLAVAMIAAAAAPLANAVIVTTWSYTVTTIFDVNSACFQSGFDNTGTQNGLGCPVSSPYTPGTESVTTTTTSWGDTAPIGGGPQSSLVIQNPVATGSIDTTTPPFSTPTGSEIGLTNIFVHNNNPITPPALDFVTALSFLSLTPTAPGGGAPGTSPPVTPAPAAGPIPYKIDFVETSNNAATCNPPSALSPPVKCPDVFVIKGPLGASNAFNIFDFFYDFDGPGGTPAQHYFVSIFPTTNILATLDPSVCAKAGATAPCQGFITEEGQANQVQFAFAITTEPFGIIPEPGILALFATALVGLGFTLRRKQA